MINLIINSEDKMIFNGDIWSIHDLGDERINSHKDWHL